MDLVRLGELGSQRRKKWLILVAVFGVSGYGVYRVYNSQYIARKTKRLTKLFSGIVSFAELVIDSAETISIVSRDLKEFLNSDSDEIPNSLKQLAKITKSKEFTDSLARVSEAVAIGVFRGYNSDQDSKNVEKETNSSFVDRVFSEEGAGFVSVVVGSFAKNLVLGFYSNETESDTDSSKPRWMSLLSDDKCRELLADCIERFTSSAVSVYIEKTVGINTYDQIFSGLTNPKHRDSARDVLVSVCNGALETFMRTSHDVFTSSREKNDSFVRKSSNREYSGNGWAEALTTTLAVPSNRKFMFDVTGRVTLETMRSVLEFVILKMSQSFKRSLDVIHEEVTERGRQVVGYVGAKSSVIITVCLAVYFHIFNSIIRGSPVCFSQRF
ncbi:PREDICTED: protein PHLOEM PROTEIN 2-LIKE A10-like [Camelina sativa]|uniref:Protein PHLOEM PROTEIN 2-LIKE A10-like n=1 Tax=Camelina sativa TaxID=90675 RepID=A0ABM0Z6C5_CAMSA|nr:PREDICTED: protein PHLOEM PROTEIN 2-LIKE A10-like [Camelina sativa]